MEKDAQKFSTGMILGKFMPPHRGHQHLIDCAREHARHITVLVCSLASEPIPGHMRFRWMKELYPDLNVIHVTDENPSEPHEHPEFWEIWTDTIRRNMPTPPDVVFTSEEYGDELARRLGARHLLVDLSRERVAISATKIRANPFEHWHHIPDCVRPYFVKRVGIVGAESTGKTTLARQLAGHYKTVWVPEHAREYLDAKNARCELSDIAHIARGQMESESRLARRANRVMFCDTDLMTTTVWSDHYFGQCPEWVRRAADGQNYDLCLLTDVDVPWVADPQRDRPHMRDYFHDRFRRELESRRRRFAIINGSFDERLGKAIRAVDALFARRDD
jgi:HTH-type transcriptional repressor of NAD biosynthesis genes